jgi:virginiamycin B lyase
LLFLVPLLHLAAGAGRAQTVSEFTIPTATTNPFSIVAGSDGNLWFTETFSKHVGRITPAGAFTEYSLPAFSTYIAAEPNAIWCTTLGVAKVDLTKLAGCDTDSTKCITVYSGVNGQGIAITPDGGLWLNQGNGVSRADKSNPSPGTTVLYPTVEHVTTTYAATLGSDGNVWFIELDHYNAQPDHTGRIAKIDVSKLAGCSTNPSQCITEYPVPGGENVVGTWMTAGPDGALWTAGSGKVNRITTAGVITQYAAANGSTQSGITSGPDGSGGKALWYAGGNKMIGKVTTSGAVTGIPGPSSFSTPRGITAGPDGNIWFVEITANKIARVNLNGAPAPTPTPTASGPAPTPTPVLTPPPHQPRGRVTPVAAPTPKTNVSGRP